MLSHPSLQCPWWCPVSTVASTMQLHYHIQITIATSLPPTLCSSPRSAKFNCGLNTFKASNGRDVAVKQQNRAQSNWTKPSAVMHNNISQLRAGDVLSYWRASTGSRQQGAEMQIQDNLTF